MERWHLEIARQQRVPVQNEPDRVRFQKPIVFERSGFQSGHWSRPVKENGRVVAHQEWVMCEILDSHSLLDEGREMRHCVASYSGRIRRRDTSIWSLVCNRKRQLTLEVRKERGAIVQIRGKCNRLAESGELLLIRDWATQNGLIVLHR